MTTIPASLGHERQCIETCRLDSAHKFTNYDTTTKACTCIKSSNMNGLASPAEQLPPVSKQDCRNYRYIVSPKEQEYIPLVSFYHTYIYRSTSWLMYPKQWTAWSCITQDRCMSLVNMSPVRASSSVACQRHLGLLVGTTNRGQRRWPGRLSSFPILPTLG